MVFVIQSTTARCGSFTLSSCFTWWSSWTRTGVLWRSVYDVKQLGIVAGDDVEAGRVKVGNGRMSGWPGCLNVDNNHRTCDGVDARQWDVLPLDWFSEIRQTCYVVNGALHLETHDSALLRRAAWHSYTYRMSPQKKTFILHATVSDGNKTKMLTKTKIKVS